MRFGARKPSVNKSISARTTGKLERARKRAINPSYGRKGSGLLKDPARASYNKVYNKTSYSVYGKRSSRSNEIDGATGCITGIVIIILMISLWFAPFGTIIAVFVGGPILLVISPIIIILYAIISSIRLNRYLKKYQNDNYIKTHKAYKHYKEL